MCQIDIVGFKPLVGVFKRRAFALLSFKCWVKGLRGESFFLGGFLLDVPFGLCVRPVDGFLVRPGYGLSWRVPCPRCAWVPLSECRGGRVVNSERGLSPGQTASVLLKQHDPCIPPQHSACGKSPDSPAKPYPGRTRKHVTLLKAQTALAEEGERKEALFFKELTRTW